MEEGSDIFSLENIRNSWLKFFEDLFRHVLQETEGLDCTTGFDVTPVVRKFERFACQSGLVPLSDNEHNEYYELSLAIAASLVDCSRSRSASALESASASGSASASRYASFSSGYASLSAKYATAGPTSESRSAPGSESGSTSVSGFEIASGSESTSGFAIASGASSTSEYASGSASASGYACASGYASGEGIKLDFSDLFKSYDRNLGLSIHRVLSEVAGPDIDTFYQSIKENIRTKEGMEMFLKRLTDKFLNGSPQQEMYFFTIISRIFSLMCKTGETNLKIFIETVADTIFRGEMELQLISSMNPHELILEIVGNSNRWVREFRDLKCGDASEYFSS